MGFVKNRIVLYVASRYLTYFLQFISLLLLASKMGPYYYGIWCFLIMVMGYLISFNFGIANSISVILIQHKSDKVKTSDYVMSGLAIITLICFVLFLMAFVLSGMELSLFKKYHVGNLIYAICLIAAMDYYNKYFCNIYRVNNRLFEVAFFQSFLPTLLFFIIILINSNYLLYVLILVYLFSYLTSFVLFLTRKGVPLKGHVHLAYIKDIFKKGIFLFLYNSCFYLILTTTSTIVSYYYLVKEYGLYSFSYNFGHSVLLILEAFTFVVFPKMIDVFYTGNEDIIRSTLEKIKSTYVVLSHGLMYIAFMFFPLITFLLPQYSEGSKVLYLICLSILLYTNAFGYNSLLIAKNKEKPLALISFLCLFINVVIGFVIATLKLKYYYMSLSIMFSYFFFSFFCVLLVNRDNNIKEGLRPLFFRMFPVSLLTPYLIALLLILCDSIFVSFVPFILFLILNRKYFKNIIETITLIVKKPSFVDLRDE